MPAHDGSHAKLRTMSCERLEPSFVSSGARDAKVGLAGLGRASEDVYSIVHFLSLLSHNVLPSYQTLILLYHNATTQMRNTLITTGSEHSPVTLTCSHGSLSLRVHTWLHCDQTWIPSCPLGSLERFNCTDSFLLLFISLTAVQLGAKT